MQQPQTQRPLGITILAILAAVAGVLGLLGSLTLMGFGLGIFGIVLLLLSVLYLVFAFGAWTLKPWAWALGVGIAVVSAVWAVFWLTQGADAVSTLINLVISGVILYYLFQPDVKAAFGRT